ncbi:MAG: hypothetical protein P8N91_00865, partial [Flavobacteriaceae bacterium]|nr:hypothetical protein [Flavobacteriaceae bacterium]
MKQYLSLFQIRKIPFYLLFLFFSLNIFSQQNYYWVGGNGNWSNYSSHWATSSGGNIFHTTSPGSNDKVIFDSNSFSQENQTITLDSDNVSVGDITWNGVTHNPKFNMGSKALIIYGSVKFDPFMTIQSPGTLKFTSSSSATLISAGLRLGTIVVEKTGGTFD